MEEEKEGNVSGNVRVVCRFRPLNEKELQTSETLSMEVSSDNKTVTIISQSESTEPLKFGFDYIFKPSAEQKDVYEISSKPIVEAVMQGFNGTVFAYGQTSSGKTFTMTGPDLEDPELMGVIPRMVGTVFGTIGTSEPYIEYAVKVSYCEIYLEKIKDLLDVTKTNLKVHEDKTRGVFIADLTERYVASEYDVYEIMKFGLQNRNVGFTNMNAVSSRSHSVFLVTVSQTNNRDYIAKTGKLYLVDLAGSEKVGKTGAAGKRLEEAKNINKSLTMLGLVIYSLTDGKSTHIPYRDSKLTRVLQDSLGGNSKTALIVTCSPSPFNEAETISTLRFGMRAKSIKNTPKINREYTVAELKLMLSKCREEINKKDRRIKALEESLKNSGGKLPALKDDNDDTIVEPEELKNEDYDEIIAELEDVRTRLAEEVKDNSDLKSEVSVLKDQLFAANNKVQTLSDECKLIKEKMGDFDMTSAEKDILIERLVVTKESLENERFYLNQRLLELEKSVGEKETELSSYNITSHSKSNKASLIELKELVKLEREVNAESQKEIQRLRENLITLLNKKVPDFTLQEIYKEEIARKERDKWIEERRNIIRDLQNSIDRVVELEISLDDTMESYKNFESNMSEGDRFLKRKIDTLEKNLQQLTIMYHQLITQKSQLAVDKQLADKKLLRNADKIKSLEEENKKLREFNEQAEFKIKMCNEENNYLKQRTSIGIGNIKKTIRGGGSFAFKNQPSGSKNPFTIDE
jgi:kinesin family member 5